MQSRYNHRMYIVGIFFLFFLSATPTLAQTPYLIDQESLHDITAIENPEYARAFYGQLENFPHTYEIRASKPFHLYTQVLVPDVDFAKNTVSGIIIKETGRGGRVEEVARLSAKNAGWESFYEPWVGDSYRRGGMFDAEVGPGVYRIEVSTPDNREPYVLLVGTIDGGDDIGYVETVRRVAGIKIFFGKTKLHVIESPYVYIPLIVIVFMAGGYWWFRRKNPRTT